MSWILPLLTFAIFNFLISVYYLLRGKRQKETRKRVDTWFETDLQKERNSVVLLLGDFFDRSELSQELEKKLKQANLSLKPSEYMGIYVLLLCIFTFINHFLLGLYLLMSLLVAYLIVMGSSKAFLSSRKNKRTDSFNSQLPEICRTMANSIKAGQTIPQAIEMVAKNTKAPNGPEFQRFNQQLKLGDNLETVMNEFRQRVPSNDVSIFVGTILIQQRVGGNLSAVLGNMAETLEERNRVHKEISTVTAESRSIAYILVVMPFLMALMMNLFIKGFLNVLFTPFGLILFVAFTAIVLCGFLIIKRITDIRV